MAVAVLVALGLTLVRPSDIRVAPAWVLPAIEVVLLGLLIVRDPGRIDRQATGLRVVSLTVVGLLALDALMATVLLIVSLIQGGSVTASAGALLAAGGVVWTSNVVVFSLLYWEIDAGGSAARFNGPTRYPDFAFVQQVSPEMAPPGWRPQFVDYLYLGVTCSTAFSPTDVMPLSPVAKMAMTCQSLIALVVVGLVVARAVNVLT
jgi:hypothetical protein